MVGQGLGGGGGRRRGGTASRNDGTFFQGTDVTVGNGFSRNDGIFFQGTDATVGDNFSRNDGWPWWATALLPWDLHYSPGRIAWGGDNKQQTDIHRDY